MSINDIASSNFAEEQPAEQQDKVVITVVGKDRVGIIAAVTSLLAENQVNIEDITQKILNEYFTMILIGDLSHCAISLADLKNTSFKKVKKSVSKFSSTYQCIPSHASHLKP